MSGRHTGIERGFDRLERWWAGLPVVRGSARLQAFPGVAVIMLLAVLSFGAAHLVASLAGGGPGQRTGIAVFVLMSLPLYSTVLAVFFVRRFARMSARPAPADAPIRGTRS